MPRTPSRGLARPMWLACGLAAVGLGVVGVALPIMPTVPFLLIAAFCFARGNPEWERRLYAHPRYGAALRDWRDRRAISRKAKLSAVIGMAAGVVFTLVTLGWLLALVSLAVLLTVGPWLWTRAE